MKRTLPEAEPAPAVVTRSYAEVEPSSSTSVEVPVPPRMMELVSAPKCCAVVLTRLSVDPSTTVRPLGVGAAVAPPEMVSEPPLTVIRPVKAIEALLSTIAEVALAWTISVTLLPIGALMVVVPVAVPELVIEPVIFTEFAPVKDMVAVVARLLTTRLPVPVTPPVKLNEPVVPVLDRTRLRPPARVIGPLRVALLAEMSVSPPVPPATVVMLPA